MSFLNQPLIWGAAAFAVPLILHILNRSRFRRVEWGAMHLLESVIQVNHKRFQIEQLLLLLVRCAIPALLAFCLARPVLTGSESLAGDSPSSIVVLLDTSYSMDAAKKGDVPRFEKAVAATQAIVESASRGSEIAVIQTGGGPSPLFDQPVFDSQAVSRRVRTLSGGHGASDMTTALQIGLQTVSQMSHAHRELIVISDFQNSDWSSAAELGKFAQQQTDNMPVPPVLTFLPFGESLTENISIESLEFSSRPIGAGQQLAVRANVKNYGVEPASLKVALHIDGQESDVVQLDLAAQSTSQTFFPCEFETAGSHVIEVKTDASDVLPTDDTFAASVTIWNEIEVLLVDGEPSSQPLKSETDFLAVALTPFSLGRLTLSDLVSTKTITPEKLNAASMETARVIVLANVSRLQEKQVDALQQFVHAGGAVLIFSGSTIDTQWYNTHLADSSLVDSKNTNGKSNGKSDSNTHASAAGILPARFGRLQGLSDQTEQAAARIAVEHFDHPSLQFFNDASNGDLSTAEIQNWLLLEPIADGQSQVVARLDNGDPLLVQRPYGDGMIMQSATACDADWSNLPMQPVFVPLMQQLVTTLATQLTPPRNIQTGEPAIVFLEAQSDSENTKSKTTAATAQQPEVLSVLTPLGQRQTIRSAFEGNRQVARFSDTRQPGVYVMTTPSADTVHFVASTQRDESELLLLDEKELRQCAETCGAEVVLSPDEYFEREKTRRHGREIWRYALMGLLALLFLELVLQQRFSKVRA